MKVAIASDHAGIQLRQHVRVWLESLSAEVIDWGPTNTQSVDYPDYAAQVAQSILSGDCQRGVLICGSGIGMSIAANRYPGIRAALCREPVSATFARAHNDANVLVLGERFTGIALAEATVRAWWTTPFDGDRHIQRLEKIERYVAERKNHV